LIAIIDGDVLCFRACKNRDYAEAKRTGFQVVNLDEDGLRDRSKYTQDDDIEYAMECYESMEKDLEELLETVYATDYVMAVKGEGNYRDHMYPEYKATRSRDHVKSNVVVPRLRKIAVSRGKAIAAHGMEADDLLRIWAEQCKQHEQEYVICSIDKDLLCIPGKHYRMHNHNFVNISEAESRKLYYIQLLMGDATDNIKGLPGIGPVKAEKMVSECKTEAEYQEVVVSNYIMYFGDDWRDQLLFNGKLIHIMRHYDDYFTFADWPITREL